jgi:uncharacterized membrane protein SpoIIM required for sporulation
MGVPPAFRELYIETKTHWWEDLNQANQVGASRIMTNNIQVTIYTFAFGAMFGVGTLFFLAYNGANIGSVLALTYRAGFGHDLVTFMAGHGVIELSCIFIAGGAGLLIGSALIMPGDLSRADALKTRGKDAIRLMMGVAVLLVLAGVIEGFISPAPIDPRIKFSIAAITGIALYSYLLFAGRDETGDAGEQGSMKRIGNALVECVPNFSEGRKIEIVERLADAIAGVETACVLDTHMDPDHNRSVITFVAAPEMVVEAAVWVVALAAELIDMRHSSAAMRSESAMRQLRRWLGPWVLVLGIGAKLSFQR